MQNAPQIIQTTRVRMGPPTTLANSLECCGRSEDELNNNDPTFNLQFVPHMLQLSQLSQLNQLNQLNTQDFQNNNYNNSEHIILNPNDQFNFRLWHTSVDERDYLNNNSSLVNNNYVAVQLTTGKKRVTIGPEEHRTIVPKDQPDNQIYSHDNFKESPKHKENPKVADKMRKTGGKRGGGDEKLLRKPRRKANTKSQK